MTSRAAVSGAAIFMSYSSHQQALPYWRLSSFYFFYFAVVGALTPFWGLYLKSLGYSSQDVGIIGAIILATRIVAPNFWGWLADRTQQRLQIIRLGSWVAAFCFAGILVDQRYSWLVLVISCYTFFWHAVLPQFEALTLTYLNHEYRRYSRIRLWGSLGFIASVVSLGWFFDWLPVRLLPVFILTFLILIWLSSLSLPVIVTTSSTIPRRGLVQLILQPSMLSFLCASFLLQLSHGFYYTFYSLYLVEHYGYSNSATGLLWALGVMAEVIIFLVMHKLLKHFDLRRLLLFSLLMATIRWLLIGCYATYLPILLVAQLLHACTFGIAHAVSIEYVRTEFAGAYQGQGQALYSSLSYGAGGATGALIGGFWWDFNASLTFILAAVAVGAGFIICYLGMHPVSNQEQHP